MNFGKFCFAFLSWAIIYSSTDNPIVHCTYRTPLTLMLGPLEESLADQVEPLTPRQRKRQNLILTNAQRILRHVNQAADLCTNTIINHRCLL